MKQKQLDKLLVLGSIVFLLIMGINTMIMSGITGTLDEKIEQQQNEAMAPEVQITVLTSASCTECFDITQVVQALETPSLNITEKISIDVNEPAANERISTYGITKLPTVIIQGDVSRLSLDGFRTTGDALVYENIPAPYLDASLSVTGLVSSVLIEDPVCDTCTDLTPLLSSLEQNGVVIKETTRYTITSSEAQQLIAQYGLTKVPVVLLSGDISVYPAIVQSMEQFGARQTDDGWYVIEATPPYVDTNSGETRGSVSFTMITDESCDGCYDVAIHKQIFPRFGLKFESEETVDISSPEGQALKSTYNLEAVPTVILKGDLGVYDGLNSVWSQVGSVEEDGTYVFRNIGALSNVQYRNLTSGDIIGATR